MKTDKRYRKTKVKSPSSRRHKTTRVTVDFPDHEHRKLRAMASLEGVTLQEYIRSHVMEKVGSTEIPDPKFRKMVADLLDENEDVLKRLSDK